MTQTFPLFYTKPEALDPTRHAGLGLKSDIGYGFSSGINALPLNMVEMAQACHVYPIAFSPDERATPVAIVGLRNDENLFVNDKGEWLEGVYIPAYARRYPFIFSETGEEGRLALCVDAVDGAVDKGAQMFFDTAGKPTQMTTNALEFCKSYHAAAAQTEGFGRALAEAGLLVVKEAQVNVPGKHRIAFSGFRIVDEEKLNALDEAVFLDFRAKGYLPFLYAHLFSGAQWERLSHLMAARLQPVARGKKK